MGNGFRCFTNESYKEIKKFNRDRLISDETYKKLEDCNDYKEVENVLRYYYKIELNRRKDIWYKIITEVWKCVRGKRKETTVFEKMESSFIKTLIERDGILSREECQHRILTDQQIKKYIPNLEKMKIISKIQVRKKLEIKTIYIIHPLIAKENNK